MSTISPSRQARAVLASEWIKLRSLRSIRATLAGTAVFSVALSVLVCAPVGAHWAAYTAAQRAQFDPIGSSLNNLQLVAVFFGALGALVVTNEYGNGLIRSTFAATPQRGRVLAAKAVLFGAGALLASFVIALAAFAAGQAVLSGRAPHASLGDPGVLGHVLGGALYLTLTGLFGLFLGAVARNTAISVSALFGVYLVLPILANSLPKDAVWRHTVPYLPSNLGVSLWDTHGSLFAGPWQAAAGLAGYVAVLAAAGTVLLRGRDA
ncbi:MAG TPA: ABC transporter permease [Pseudonocardiaceae bacterium]|nr:ABC transporter permease [Pseudonocardiaceae bacterium]